MQPFHLAVQVDDLATARAFYGGVLGCAEGRSAADWVDFDLFGHQLVCHRVADVTPQAHHNTVEGVSVPVPHFGVVLSMDSWQTLADRLALSGTPFIVDPHIRFRGEAGEQGTFFIADPAGNALEFKGFRNPGQLFAR